MRATSIITCVAAIPHSAAASCRVVAAVQDQMTRGIHLQQNCMISQPMVQLCEKLNECTPEGISRFFFNGAWDDAMATADQPTPTDARVCCDRARPRRASGSLSLTCFYRAFTRIPPVIASQ